MLRPILAVLIAISIAVLPASAGLMAAAKGSEPAMSATAPMSMPVDCPHHGIGQSTGSDHSKGSKTADGCASMIGCAVSCFNYAGTQVPALTLAAASFRIQPVPAADLVVSNRGSPPFRPPRI